MLEMKHPKFVQIVTGEVDPDTYDDWINNGPYMLGLTESGEVWIYWFEKGSWETLED